MIKFLYTNVLGVINEDRLRELLTTMGDRFTDEEVPTAMCALSF